MGGDHVAAQYLLCNIISNIFQRVDSHGMLIGKLALNISGLSPAAGPLLEKCAPIDDMM